MQFDSAPIDEPLERPLLAVEACLEQLGQALQRRDGVAVEMHASELQMALQQAVGHFSAAARNGGVPPGLRHRLVQAGGKVAAQRESLARATASLDRAIDVLMPAQPTGFYSALGRSERKSPLGTSYQA